MGGRCGGGIRSVPTAASARQLALLTSISRGLDSSDFGIVIVSTPCMKRASNRSPSLGVPLRRDVGALGVADLLVLDASRRRLAERDRQRVPILHRNLRREFLTVDEVIAQLREHGIGEGLARILRVEMPGVLAIPRCGLRARSGPDRP